MRKSNILRYILFIVQDIVVLDGEKAVVDMITNKEAPSLGIFEQLAKLQETIKNKKELNIFKGFMDAKNNEDVKNKSSEFMKTIGKTLNINIPMLGGAWELFGVKRPVDILGSKEKRNNNKFLNWILKIFWFKKWVQGLHESYIEEQVKWSDMGFVKDCFADYQKNQKTDIAENDSTRAICGIEDLIKDKKPEQVTAIKAKIPQDYTNLKSTIVKTLPNHINKLSINTVRMVDPSLIITKDKKEVVDIQKIQANPEEFVDNYLKTTIPAFVDSWDEFIDSKKVVTDAFTVALFGNLTGEKFFVEWVNLWIITAAQMWKIEAKPATNNTAEVDPNQASKITTELNTVKNCPLTADMIIKASKEHKVSIAYIMAIMKNDSSYGTAGKAIRTHNPGNVGNMDDGSSKDRWTREAWVNAVAQNLSRRITEYQNVYGSDKTPKLEELAKNQGPDGKWFLPKYNYKKDNPERVGGYMTAEKWPQRVEDYANNFTDQWLTLAA